MTKIASDGVNKSHYGLQSAQIKTEALSADIAAKSRLLQAAERRGRIRLDDAEAVKTATFAYLADCESLGIFPTVMGLSCSFGLSRQGLNKHMRTNPHSETTRFLESVKDLFADILANSALFRNADPALSIFILKNCAGMVDRVEIEAHPTENPLGAVPTAEEQAALQARILDAIVDD